MIVRRLITIVLLLMLPVMALLFAVQLYVAPVEVTVNQSEPLRNGWQAIIFCRRQAPLLETAQGLIKGRVPYNVHVSLKNRNTGKSLLGQSIGPTHESLESAKSYVKTVTLEEGRSQVVLGVGDIIPLRVPFTIPAEPTEEPAILPRTAPATRP